MRKLFRNWLKASTMGGGITLALCSLFSAGTANAEPAVSLIGSFNSWDATKLPNASDYTGINLTKTAENVYSVTNPDIPAGYLEFKVLYTSSGTWDSSFWNNAYGSWLSGNPSVDLVANVPSEWPLEEGDAHNGGNFMINNWGGQGTITVNLSTNKVTVECPVVAEVSQYPDALWARGLNGSWDNTDANKLVNSTEHPNIFTGTFTNVTNASSFKIADASYGQYNYGAGSPSTIAVYSNVPGVTNLVNSSQTNFGISNWTSGGTMEISFNVDTAEITVKGTSQPEYTFTTLYVPGLGGWPDTSWADVKTLTKQTDGSFTGTFSVDTSDDPIEFKITGSQGWTLGNWGASVSSFNLWGDSDCIMDLVPNGQNFVISNWAGGDLTLTVDKDITTITIEGSDQPDEHIYLYLKGNDVNGEDTWKTITAPLTEGENNIFTWKGTSLGTGFKIADANYTDYDLGAEVEGTTISLGTPLTLVNKNSNNVLFADATYYVANPELTLDLENLTLTLNGTMTKFPVESVVIQGALDGNWVEGGEQLFALTADAENENLWSGTMTGLTPESSFKVLVNGKFWFGWGDFALYSNAPVNVNLNSETDSNVKFTNIESTSTVNVSVNWETGEVTFSSEDQPKLQPEKLWVVGPFNNWTLENNDYVLEQTEENSGIYSGTFDWDETCEYNGEDVNFASFKFAYGTASDWSETLGNPIKEEKVLYGPNAVYETNYTAGGGQNWTIANWAGGEITITVDMNENEGTVTIECPDQPEFAYPATVALMGSFDNWGAGLLMDEEGSGVYKLDTTIPTPTTGKNVELQILADDTKYGPAPGQSTLSLTLNTPVTYDLVETEDAVWTLQNWYEGQVVFVVTFTVEGASMEVTQKTGVNSIENALNGDEVIYNLQGIRVNKANLGKGLYIINGKKVLVK